MQSVLKPNHLAEVIDHQKSAASALPKPLMEKCTWLNELTQDIRTLMDGCLPKEILETLWVGKYDDGNLTLSVQSNTAANHLRYHANNLINILKEQSFTFTQLKNIDVIVTFPASINHLNNNEQMITQDIKQSNLAGDEVKSHNLRGLTQTTRRTIAHTAKHVIKDGRLKKSLERLSKS